MHKYHVTVASSRPAAALREKSQVELTARAERAKEILIMIILRAIFEHFQITVSVYLDFIQVSRGDFIFGILNSLEDGRIILPGEKLGK